VTASCPESAALLAHLTDSESQGMPDTTTEAVPADALHTSAAAVGLSYSAPNVPFPFPTVVAAEGDAVAAPDCVEIAGLGVPVDPSTTMAKARM
jgi:hypothetical protein